ncbi:MAG: putative transporter [Muribaculaceae bacterium]|nr:putative transporter [Muribaculaceae bacterium]
MDWLQSVFIEQSAVQAVIVLSIIIAVGLALGKIQVFGVSLGVTWVFFAGILAGHVGLSIDSDMLVYAESFGLVLFVYELGLKVGPGFFSSFRKGGVRLNLLGLATVLLGTVTAVGLTYVFRIPMADMVGILSGATTNTPSLGAAQQALSQLGESASGAALSCAVTYPLGVIGVILAIILVRKAMVRPSDITTTMDEEDNHTFIATYLVKNPGVYDKSVRDIVRISNLKFVISRLWRDGDVSIPTSDTVVKEGDRLMVIATDKDGDALTLLFGEHESRDWNTGDIDWNKIDSSLTSRHIVVSKPEINGHKLGSLKLRNNYGINITRVSRSGVSLLATPGLILQLGDRLTVVGKENQIEKVAKVVGNTESKLKDPNLAVIFVGMVLGLLLGSVPVVIPGISVPVKLGLAGGPIVVGILMGRYGPRFHMVTYTTRSANLMLRGIGLSLYLACLGLDAGAHFVETIMRGDGLLWIGAGFIITLIPVVIMELVAMRFFHLDFGSTCGMVCGAMANPMAMNYASETLPGDNPAVSYATVYPLAMFTRVVIAQILVLVFH